MADATNWIELGVNTIATLVAAFGGGFFAFKIQNRKEKKITDDENIVQGNMAIFIIIRHYNRLLNYKNQVIAQWADHPHRHHFIKPSLSESISIPKIDFQKIAFVLNNNPNLIAQIAILEQDIIGTLEMIEQRSKIHFDHLQPVIESIERSLEKDNNKIINVEEVERQLGTRMTIQLSVCTDYVVSGVERGLEGTKNLSHDLAVELKKIYPKANFLTIVG